MVTTPRNAGPDRPRNHPLLGEAPVDTSPHSMAAVMVAVLHGYVTNGRVSYDDLVAATGMGRTTVHKTLLALRDAGLVAHPRGPNGRALQGAIHPTCAVVIPGRNISERG